MPETDETEAVFTVTYECGNCGNVFEEAYPPGKEVTEGSTRDPQVRDQDCESLGLHACDCCYRVHCGTCEVAGLTTVVKREPLEA